MHRSSLRSLSLLLPCVIGLATAIAIPIAHSAAPHTEVGFVVNVGAAIQPFVPNYGQDADDVQYAARSFGGTVFVRDDALSVALAATPEEHRSTLTARFTGVAALDVEPGPLHAALANFYLGADPGAWLEDLPSHASVELLGVATGVDIGVDASGRDLRWSIDAATPANVGALVWTYDNLKALQLAPDGSLLVTLPAYDELGNELAGETRVVRVAKPRAWQTGKGSTHSRTANFVIDGDTVRVEVTGGWSTIPVLVEVMTRYSEVRHGQDQQLAGESVWSEGSSDPLIAGTEADATVDMLGVRYNSDGDKITAITVVGGDGNSAGHGLGLSLDGRVWMSGTTIADDFPTYAAIQPTRAGGTDAVIVELDEDGHLITSSYYGGAGDDEGEDVEVDSGGVLWLAGKAELPIDGPTFGKGDQFGTTFSGSGQANDFFVTAIDTATLDVRGTTCFGGNTSNGDVAVNIDEIGKVWIGQPAQPSSATWFFFPFEQNGAHTGCDRISEAWSFEALCWKYNVASQSTPGLNYYPHNSNAPLQVAEHVMGSNAASLNTFEADPSLFTFDPGGTWEGPYAFLTPSDINTASTGAEVAIAAALYMHRWGSPVYANGVTPVSQPQAPDAIGIHQVIFRGLDPSDDPAQACTGFVDSTDPGWMAHPIYQVAENCALSPDFEVHDLEYSYWDHQVNQTAYVASRWTGATTSWFVPSQGNSYNQAYVGDPPAEEAFMVEHIGEFAALIGPAAREQVMIIRRWYDGGALVSESEAVESARVNY